MGTRWTAFVWGRASLRSQPTCLDDRGDEFGRHDCDDDVRARCSPSGVLKWLDGLASSASNELMWERNGFSADGLKGGELEIEVGVEPIELGRFDQRVHDCGDFCASHRAGAVVIFPANHDASERPLRLVVVERHLGVGPKTPASRRSVFPSMQWLCRADSVAAPVAPMPTDGCL